MEEQDRGRSAGGGADIARQDDTVGQAMAGLSARDGAAAWQVAALLAAISGLSLSAWAAPSATLFCLLLLSSVFFLGVAALRLTAVAVALRAGVPAGPGPADADADLPVYTVLVPLYREANVVPRLIAALERLDYPRERLDIRLLVEVDDPETARALRAAATADHYEIVVVPEGRPRTKPRALNVGLAGARGALVTIFDAEDMPEPDQLRRAAAAFGEAEPEVACFQARLAWYNWTDNWLTRQFAIEYASLFDVFLPALERLGLPIPLGGTSNHFRADLLIKVGAWDAWNVTEDADLGMRLTRAGYRCRTLASTTWEEAPNRFRPWLSQRTRWLKGWMQTYMVHMRRPGDLARRIGLRGFVAFQLLIGGMIVSALAHPAFFAIVIAQVASGDIFLGLDSGPATTLILLGAFNLAAGYAAGFAIGFMALRRRPMAYLAGDLPWLPAYWLMMSVAAFRALWQLGVRPFHWEKTPHGLDRTVAPLPRLNRPALQRGAGLSQHGEAKRR